MNNQVITRYPKGMVAQGILYFGIFLLIVAVLIESDVIALAAQPIVLIGLVGGFLISSECHKSGEYTKQIHYSLWLKYSGKRRMWGNKGITIRARGWATTLIVSIICGIGMQNDIKVMGILAMMMVVVTFPLFLSWLGGLWFYNQKE